MLFSIMKYFSGKISASQRILIVLIVFVGPVASTSGDRPTWFGRLPIGAKGVVIPFYRNYNSQAEGVLRIDKVSKDFQRKGFFRIGLLSTFVMDGVTFEFRDRAFMEQTLAELQERLNPGRGTDFIEMRRVQFLFNFAPSMHLQAKRVRFGAQGQWQLLDGVVYQVGSQQWKARQGTLQVTGKQTGQIYLETLPAPEIMNIIN